MSNTSTPAASSAASDSPSNDGPTLAEMTEVNEARALGQAAGRRINADRRAAAGIGAAPVIAAFGVALDGVGR
jgi:hypothetical protein